MPDRVEFLHDGDHAPEFMIEETRFLAEFGEIRVVCRIERRGWYTKFGSNKSGPRGRAAVFEKNRALIERAAERKILAGDFDSKSWDADPATWSILLTGDDLKIA